MREALAQVFARLQEEPGSPPAPAGWRILAGALAGVYGLAARGRRRLYDRGWRRRRRLPCRVVSVGNLTVGGTGKTPFTALLAGHWLSRGRRVAIVSRGYGGSGRGVQVIADGERLLAEPPLAADEPVLLARRLPGAAVVTGGCRYAAGRLAWERFHPEIIILDDGFQHFQLHRDAEVVLLDAERPFGNGRLLPRGPLREPPEVLRPPMTLVLTRYREERHRATLEALQRDFPGLRVLRTALTPSRLTLLPEERELPLASLAGRRVAAFAGLARPRVVAASLAELGAEVTEFLAFPDHHNYHPAEVRELAARAAAGEAAWVTTEKDWVRLAGRWPRQTPLLILEVEAQLLDPWPEDWQ